MKDKREEVRGSERVQGLLKRGIRERGKGERVRGKREKERERVRGNKRLGR